MAASSHTEQDTLMPFVLGGIALFVVPIFALYVDVVEPAPRGVHHDAGDGGGRRRCSRATTSSVPHVRSQARSSNNPVSAITIATILFAALLLLWLHGNRCR